MAFVICYFNIIPFCISKMLGFDIIERPSFVYNQTIILLYNLSNNFTCFCACFMLL